MGKEEYYKLIIKLYKALDEDSPTKYGELRQNIIDNRGYKTFNELLRKATELI